MCRICSFHKWPGRTVHAALHYKHRVCVYIIHFSVVCDIPLIGKSNVSATVASQTLSCMTGSASLYHGAGGHLLS